MRTRTELRLALAAQELADVMTRIGPHGPWEFRGEDRMRVCLAIDRVKDAVRASEEQAEFEEIVSPTHGADAE